MNSASDLVVALVATSYLDAALAQLLEHHFIDPASSNLLLGIDGPLESFGARSRAARVLGLISAPVFGDLQKAGKIRNRFAHHHTALDFSDQQVKDWCDAFSLNHDPIDVAAGKPMKMHSMSEAHRIRTRFQMVVVTLADRFVARAREMKK